MNIKKKVQFILHYYNLNLGVWTTSILNDGCDTLYIRSDYHVFDSHWSIANVPLPDIIKYEVEFTRCQ